jgi:hypothetical protein
MEHLPIPHLYRVTNNHFIPSINTVWVSDSGDTVKVTKVLSKRRPVIICYKNLEPEDNFGSEELSVSLHKFHSLFSSFDSL